MRARALVVAVVGLTGIMGACGSDDDGTSAPAESGTESTEAPGDAVDQAPYNEADVAFAQGMIPHHQQAVEMAQLAADRAGDEAVRELAARIEAAQVPEIAEMTAWLEAWGEDVPASGTGGEDHEGMDMGDETMPGVMTDDDMAALEAASGAEFDAIFLEQMTAHHEGALLMAETEIADGEFPDAIALAERIVETQQAEIDEMVVLRGGSVPAG